VNHLDWIQIGGVLFAIAFLVGGIFRIVEFNDVTMTRGQRRFAIVAHVLGCILFSAAIALGSIDTHQDEKAFTMGFFIFSLAFLFPVQIYLNLKRRRKKV